MRVLLDGVTHGFIQNKDLFTNFSAELLPNRVYALMGPSGSGKSTLLSLIAGWHKPNFGIIKREGITKIGWVFQNPYGVPQRTAIDHVILPLLAGGISRKDALAQAQKLLEEFGLLDIMSHKFSDLSGGEAQRLMLVRGVAARPQLFLVDEPTAQLDVHMAKRVNQSLRTLSERGLIVVVATHDQRTRDACTDLIDLAGC